jgi:hypothetical protein
VRSALVALVTEHWSGRGARLCGKKWSRAAEWKDDAQERFAVAMSPPSPRGWVTLVESAELSLSVDEALLSAIAARAPAWASWNFDHASVYGQKRMSKLGAEAPVDLGAAQAYSALRDAEGWTFLVFAGVRPMAWKRFSPGARTKSDPLPRDEDQELSSAFADAVRSLDVDEAIAIARRLGARLGDSELSTVFDEDYPIEWPETADGVARIGSAIAEVRPLPAWAWVRLLEVAAVRNDAELRARAEGGLSGSDAAERAPAIEEAVARFAARSPKVAAKRFAEWTGAKPRRRSGR